MVSFLLGSITQIILSTKLKKFGMRLLQLLRGAALLVLLASYQLNIPLALADRARSPLQEVDRLASQLPLTADRLLMICLTQEGDAQSAEARLRAVEALAHDPNENHYRLKLLLNSKDQKVAARAAEALPEDQRSIDLVQDFTSYILPLHDRPKIRQVLAATNGDLASISVKAVEKDPRVAKIKSKAAGVIAALEYAYPGAVWAPLGRDSAFLGDILEAYYLSRGMKNRVVRLNASTPSFDGATSYLRFMENHGLKRDANGRPIRPFVALDATNWEGTETTSHSQVRKLVASVYQAVPGPERPSLLGRIAAVGQGARSQQRTHNGKMINPKLDVEKFQNKLTVTETGPSQILYITQVFAYGDKDWHGKFGPFVEQSDGSMIATPGKPATMEQKRSILSGMLQTASYVGSPEFAASVREEAARFGFSIDSIEKHPEIFDDHLRARFIAQAYQLSEAAKLNTSIWLNEAKASLLELETWEESTRDLPKTARLETGRVLGSLVLKLLSELPDASSICDDLHKRLREWTTRYPELPKQIASGLALHTPIGHQLRDIYKKVFSKFLNLEASDDQVVLAWRDALVLEAPQLAESTELKALSLKVAIERFKGKSLQLSARLKALATVQPFIIQADELISLFNYAPGSESEAEGEQLAEQLLISVPRLLELGASPAKILADIAPCCSAAIQTKLQTNLFARANSVEDLGSMIQATDVHLLADVAEPYLRLQANASTDAKVTFYEKLQASYSGAQPPATASARNFFLNLSEQLRDLLPVRVLSATSKLKFLKDDERLKLTNLVLDHSRTPAEFYTNVELIYGKLMGTWSYSDQIAIAHALKNLRGRLPEQMPLFDLMSEFRRQFPRAMNAFATLIIPEVSSLEELRLTVQAWDEDGRNDSFWTALRSLPHVPHSSSYLVELAADFSKLQQRQTILEQAALQSETKTEYIAATQFKRPWFANEYEMVTREYVIAKTCGHYRALGATDAELALLRKRLKLASSQQEFDQKLGARPQVPGMLDRASSAFKAMFRRGRAPLDHETSSTVAEAAPATERTCGSALMAPRHHAE